LTDSETFTETFEKLPIRVRQIAKIIECACGCGLKLLDRDKYGNQRQRIYGHCHTGFRKYEKHLIYCKCGCERKLWDTDKKGRLREYLKGHSSRRDKTEGWKVGKFKHEGYWCIFKPDHHYANKNGYVYEHRLIYEEYYKVCLLPTAEIHHRDGNGLNNDINNLILTSKPEHRNKYHRKDWHVTCRCGSRNVRGAGVIRNKYVFKCEDCEVTFRIPIIDLQIMIHEYKLGLRKEIKALHHGTEHATELARLRKLSQCRRCYACDITSNEHWALNRGTNFVLCDNCYHRYICYKPVNYRRLKQPNPQF
jgi:hypothetical protein